ncbi:SDR family oxidoreductase [Thalassotalea mangrovi]|uniref:SDR family oxidoreductase n=1 Tax=Thalassotalea mangrovi TaxID=2572245 RepID=A0A4V5NTV9_9GAMM|nr:SDR family oxidoreductase [Thalassotalea mangrovi]TKB43062.1 SDR family oxidoreductase [Thalassotalea mangrovi]
MKLIITGATSGIGRALTELFANDSHNLAICGRNTEKMDDLLAQQVVASQVKLSRCFCSTNQQAIENFVNDASAALGGLDVLINCAGANSARATLETIDFADLDCMYQVNLRAPAVFSQAAFKQMKKQGSGKIINIHSTVCLFSNPGIGAYTATKSGFDALTKVFRKEAAADNVDVINVYPGGVNSNFRQREVDGYMDARSVAQTIKSLLDLADNVIPHELVIRPGIERNFA